MTLRWTLVRHAPTGAAGAVGWSDVPADLSDDAALGRLAASLPQGAPVVSSDLARAVATADRIAGGRPRLPPEPGLREIRFGDWEGLAFDAIAERWPDESRAFWDAPGPSRAPGGEGLDDLAARVATAMDRIADGLGGSGEVVAVAHMGSIMAALARALDVPPAAALRFRVEPLSITRLDRLSDGRWAVGCVNYRR